ncbi:MAG: XRE family transcriptional regulator [Bacteroidales bacterium]|nr:XRE family transcriptional regulator [Bacteroidales bacterium]
MQELEEIHIGNAVCDYLKKTGRSKKWLAAQVHCEYSNFCKLLAKQYIDTELLIRISCALHHNFFSYIEHHVHNMVKTHHNY